MLRTGLEVRYDAGTCPSEPLRRWCGRAFSIDAGVVPKQLLHITIYGVLGVDSISMKLSAIHRYKH